MEKLVKNVDQKSWLDIKYEATRHGLNIGQFLTYLIKDYKRRETKKNPAWDYIFNAKKRLSNKDAEEIKRHIEEAFEKDIGFEG